MILERGTTPPMFAASGGLDPTLGTNGQEQKNNKFVVSMHHPYLDKSLRSAFGFDWTVSISVHQLLTQCETWAC